ncbi:hypothetical protein [Clostridium rectalis]|uniref:hypothetical protein n=1 Tax=Clostridium rectalis TaxID=2040295 RepID=UPI000F631CF7|nr:hypothetical protein [Clostridium rectalis]
MMLKKDEVIKIAEEILCLLQINGYNIEQMSPEEVGELVDEYLNDLYQDFIENYDNIYEEYTCSYDNFEDYYKDFTKKFRNKSIHIDDYLN